MSQETLNKLVDVVLEWHSKGHKIIDEILNTPDDKPLQIQMGDDTVKLEGKDIQYFRIGLITAQMVFKDLPFKAVKNAVDTEETEG